MRFGLFILLFLTFVPAAFATEYKTYAETRTIADKLAFGTVELKSYEGGPEDTEYLKEYILELATRSYGVDASFFDKPTLASTSLLRDLVSKMNHQQKPEQEIMLLARQKKLKYKVREDIAELWRYPSWGVCAHVALALYNVYKSFGYQAKRIDTMNGTWETYDQSHAMNEVYVEDLGKFILQDPQYNMVALDASGKYLSFAETKAMLDKNEEPEFRTFLFMATYPYNKKNYESFPMTPIPYEGMDFVFDIENIRKNYYRNIYRERFFDGKKETVTEVLKPQPK